MNSRQKGARGERQAAAAWSQALQLDPFTCRRGQQFHGGKDSPDVVQPIRDIHLEVKRVERGNPYDWIIQAANDSVEKIPVVLHKRNHMPWLMILRLEDVQRFLLAAETYRKAQAVGGEAMASYLSGEGVSPAERADAESSWLFRHG